MDRKVVDNPKRRGRNRGCKQQRIHQKHQRNAASDKQNPAEQRSSVVCFNVCREAAPLAASAEKFCVVAALAAAEDRSAVVVALVFVRCCVFACIQVLSHEEMTQR